MPSLVGSEMCIRDSLHLADGKVNSVTVDMGIPADEPADYDGKGAKPMKEQPIEVDGERYVGTTVSMGNPHLVIFVCLLYTSPSPRD